MPTSRRGCTTTSAAPTARRSSHCCRTPSSATATPPCMTLSFSCIHHKIRILSLWPLSTCRILDRDKRLKWYANEKFQFLFKMINTPALPSAEQLTGDDALLCPSLCPSDWWRMLTRFTSYSIENIHQIWIVHLRHHQTVIDGMGQHQGWSHCLRTCLHWCWPPPPRRRCVIRHWSCKEFKQWFWSNQ